MDLFLPSINSKYEIVTPRNLEESGNEERDDIGLPINSLLDDWIKALPPTPCQSLPPVFRDLIKNDNQQHRVTVNRRKKNDDNTKDQKKKKISKKDSHLPTIREQSRKTKLSQISRSLDIGFQSPQKSYKDDVRTSTTKLSETTSFDIKLRSVENSSTSSSPLPNYSFTEQIYKTKPSIADSRKTDLLKIRNQNVFRTTLCSSIDFENLKDNALYVSSEEINVFAKCQNWLDNYT